MPRHSSRRSSARGALLATAIVTLVSAVAALASPALARDRVLDATDAVLRRPSERVTRILGPLQGCQVLLDSGDGDCAVVHTAHGDLVVTVEPGPALDDVGITRPWVVRVYRPDARVEDGWQVALATRRERWGEGWQPGPLYANVTAKAADVTGDGRDELAIGYRSDGTGMILDVDVVTTDAAGSPRVLAHDQIYKGSVVFRNGALVAYEPVYRQRDANCCPTWIERDVLRLRAGRLYVDPGPRVRARRVEVPPSELG